MRFLLILVAFVALPGQPTGLRVPALQDAIGLTDLQLRQLEQACPTTQYTGYPRMPECTLRFLNPVQRAKVGEFAKLVNRRDVATEAVSLGLMHAEEWPFGTLCLHPIYSDRSLFRLTADQIVRLMQLRGAVRLGVLEEAQKKQLVIFQSDVQIASQALRVGLISCPMCGAEVLCP